MKELTDDQLTALERQLYAEWMYYEAASRGWDRSAASAAEDAHLKVRAELELRRCRNSAEPVSELMGIVAQSLKE